MAIYIHDEAARLRLRVTGDLDHDAARELTSCWATASSVLAGRGIAVDLTGLHSADSDGRQALQALHQQGVEFLGKSEFQAELIGTITGKQQENQPQGIGSWLKGMLGVARA